MSEVLLPIYRCKLEIQAWLLMRTRVHGKIRYIGDPGWPVAVVGQTLAARPASGIEQMIKRDWRTVFMEKGIDERDQYFAKLYFEALEPYEPRH